MLFNVSGTNNKSFSIGSGINKSELVTIEGRLYLKNFDSSELIDIASKELGILEIVNWEPELSLSQNNLVIYDGSIFLTKVTHITSVLFNEEYFDFLFSYNKLLKITANNGNTYQLLKSHGTDIYFFGDNSGTQIVILPNSLLENNGKTITIYNFSNCIIEIYLFDQSTYFATLRENQVNSFLLVDNLNSNGLWSEVNFWQQNQKLNEIKIDEVNVFQIGDILGHNGTNFVKINVSSNITPIGIVSESNDFYFILTLYGYINLENYLGTSTFPLISGNQYYLSKDTIGNWELNPGLIKLPALTAISVNEGIINFRNKITEIYEELIILNNQSIFRNLSDGIYKLYDSNNPENYVTISYKNGSYIHLINSIFSNNLFSDVFDSSGTINIFESTNLYIQNKTGNTLNLVLISLKGQW